MADQKFHVPQAEVQYRSGFLTEYWKDARPLPRMTSWEVPRYFFEQGIRQLLVLPMTTMITLLTVAITLFVFASFLIVLKNVDRALASAGGRLEVSVYLKRDIESAKVDQFIEELLQSRLYRSVKFVSSEEALRQLEQDLADEASVLLGLAEENPLPPSVDLLFHEDELGIGQVAEAVRALRERHDLVEEVVYGSEWVDRIQGVVRVVRLFGFAALAIILGIVVVLIANTIKLVIYARRDEIGIMKLVGASDDYIQVPFMIGGIVQGILGAVVALSVLRCCVWLMNFELKRSVLLGTVVPDIAFLSPFSWGAVILVGLVVGAVGSLVAIRQFINV